MPLLALIVILLTWQPAAAQGPSVFVAPNPAAGGQTITVRGINFDPGGYDGVLFWDGVAVDALTIPRGGDFSIEFRIPPTATASDHLLRVCAADGSGRCFGGEFEQAAETEVAVTGPAPIRICKEEVESCSGHGKAIVYNISNGKEYGVDDDGYVLDRELISAGDLIWALALNTEMATYRVYSTTGDPVAVEDNRFQADPTEMRLAVTEDDSLLVFDLDVSAEWYVQGNQAYADWLTTELMDVSNFFYDFTDGQMLLGDVRVMQDGDGLPDADVRLLANNTLRPNAEVGGITNMEVNDPLSNVTFVPGQIFMGSYWNRYAQPPGQVITEGGQVVPPASLEDDWALALTHELGHYLLYLFDTYRDAEGESSPEIAAACFGSAMGDVYDAANHAFIADPGTWEARCSETEAYIEQRGNSEWATMDAWYPWLTLPQAPGAQQEQPPIPMTNVFYVPPSTPPGVPATGQLFDLNYQDEETASGEARALIYRNGRILDQGKPGEGSSQISLVGAQVNDRLCVYDVNDYAESGDSPRHQFGCERILPNDAVLEMTKDEAWAPTILISQVATDTLTISVTEEVELPLMARFYPEHDVGYTEFPLTSSAGSDYFGEVVFSESVLPGYVQLWVDEAVNAPTTSRETIVDRGTGGGGLFGPARRFSGVFVYSSDGKATYERDGDVELQPGESISWQSMSGTPPLPIDRGIIGQSYLLSAFPEDLVQSGTVRIEYQEISSTLSAANLEEPEIHFFDGENWISLPTSNSVPNSAADGTKKASAPSMGVGVYAVLTAQAVRQIWLPTIMTP